MKRAMAALLAATMIASACTSSDESTPGVGVESEMGLDDLQITVVDPSADHLETDAVAASSTPVSPVFDITVADPKTRATVVFDVPADYEGDPTALFVVRYSEELKRWEPLTSTYDPDSHTVSADTDHFTWFQLVERQFNAAANWAADWLETHLLGYQEVDPGCSEDDELGRFSVETPPSLTRHPVSGCGQSPWPVEFSPSRVEVRIANQNAYAILIDPNLDASFSHIDPGDDYVSWLNRSLAATAFDEGILVHPGATAVFYQEAEVGLHPYPFEISAASHVVGLSSSFGLLLHFAPSESVVGALNVALLAGDTVSRECSEARDAADPGAIFFECSFLPIAGPLSSLRAVVAVIETFLEGVVNDAAAGSLLLRDAFVNGSASLGTAYFIYERPDPLVITLPQSEPRELPPPPDLPEPADEPPLPATFAPLPAPPTDHLPTVSLEVCWRSTFCAQTHGVLRLPGDAAGDIVLDAEGTEDAEGGVELLWFINGNAVSSSEMFTFPIDVLEPGMPNHVLLVVTDTAGQSSAAGVSVVPPEAPSPSIEPAIVFNRLQEDLEDFSEVGLYVLDVGSEPTRLTSEPDLAPDWSPDYQQIGFLRSPRIEDPDEGIDVIPRVMVISRDGTGETDISDMLVRAGNIPGSFGFSWSPEGDEVVADAGVSVNGDDRGIWIVSLESSQAREVVNDPGWHEAYPEWSPDGRWVAYVAAGSQGQQLRIVDVNSGQVHVVTECCATNRTMSWTPDSRLLYTQTDFEANSERMLTFDPATGDRATLLERVQDPGSILFSRASPDGRYVAYIVSTATGATDSEPNSELEILDLQTFDRTRITSSDALELQVTWSPDSDRLAYTNLDLVTGDRFLFVVDITGSSVGDPVGGVQSVDWSTHQPSPPPQTTTENEPPQARLCVTFFNGSACEGETLLIEVGPDGPNPLTFSASRSSDPDGTIVSVEWFVEETPAGTGEETVFDALELPGDRNAITVRVTDDDGVSSEATMWVEFGH